MIVIFVSPIGAKSYEEVFDVVLQNSPDFSVIRRNYPRYVNVRVYGIIDILDWHRVAHEMLSFRYLDLIDKFCVSLPLSKFTSLVDYTANVNHSLKICYE